MQVERRRDGEIFVLEAISWDSALLEPLRREWPRSYIQWERDGVPVRGEDGKVKSSGPSFALWRPAPLAPAPRPLPPIPDEADDFDTAPFLSPPPAASAQAPQPADELEDPADFLFADEPLALEAPAAPVELPPLEPAAAEQVLPPPDVAEQPAPDTEQLARRGPRARRPPRELKSTRHKNITRVDRPSRNMYGFHVRMGWQGQVFQKWFSDEKHGDRLGALAAAIAWRDEQERQLGKPRSERTLIGRTKSSTGYVGVTKVTLKDKVYYRALWHDEEGRMHRRFFNIERLGEKRALRAAIKARAEGAAHLLR